MWLFTGTATRKRVNNFPHYLNEMRCGALSWQPAGARGCSSYNGNNYFVSTTKRTQSDARSDCQSLGGDLTSITDAAEDSFIDSSLYVPLSAA